MYKIEIKISTKDTIISKIIKPKEVEIIVVNDEFLNASGDLSEIVICFVFEAMSSGILEKVGENIFDYIKKIISENNVSKAKSDIKIQIESKDIKLYFSGKNLNSNNSEIALKKISKYLDKINTQSYSKHSINNSLVFDESSKKWNSEDNSNSKWINNLRNEAMEDFNE